MRMADGSGARPIRAAARSFVSHCRPSARRMRSMPADHGTVYVIDDDEAIRDSLSFLLESADIPVVRYPSAAAFLRQLPAINGGCIITDVRMPEVTGIDLLRDLRSRGIDVPVIVITGHADV